MNRKRQINGTKDLSGVSKRKTTYMYNLIILFYKEKKLRAIRNFSLYFSAIFRTK